MSGLTKDRQLLSTIHKRHLVLGGLNGWMFIEKNRVLIQKD